MMRYSAAPLALVLVFGLATGCGHKSDRAPLDVSLTRPADEVTGDRVEALRAEVRKRIEINARTLNEQKARLQYRAPYWFKEYAEYTGGSNDFEVQTSTTESRTAPMTASVEIDRLRFSTRLHRERKEAAADDNFLRDTGSESLSYEFRNGRWHLNGSTFVADKSEELVAGEWVPVEETQQRTVAEEEKPGWFTRTWSTITGR